RLPDRTRHEAGDGNLGANRGSRPRREDRRRLARRGAQRPPRHRRIPRPVRLMALLELRGVDAAYGRIQALRGVSVDVGQTEVVALIGSNGAGKTTTLRTISGLMHPAAGTISFNDRDITRVGPDKIVGLGICQSPEGRRLFPRMSVND